MNIKIIRIGMINRTDSILYGGATLLPQDIVYFITFKTYVKWERNPMMK